MKQRQVGHIRHWSHLGLLMAVTAGVWCLTTGIAQLSAGCPAAAAGASADCSTDFAPQLTLVAKGQAAVEQSESFSGSSSASEASRSSFDLSSAALARLDSRFSVERSPLSHALFHIAPKQSPPALLG